jgi:hypothetical protein
LLSQHRDSSSGPETGFGSAIGEEAGVLQTVALGSCQWKGWQVTSGSHSFLQLNQSEVLSEFVTAILDAHTSGSATAANVKNHITRLDPQLRDGHDGEHHAHQAQRFKIDDWKRRNLARNGLLGDRSFLVKCLSGPSL